MTEELDAVAERDLRDIPYQRGPNLDSLRVVEAKRRTCTGCGKRRMTKQLIPISIGAALCSECLAIRDDMMTGKI